MRFITLGKEIITTKGIQRVFTSDYLPNSFCRALGEKTAFIIRIEYRKNTCSILYDNAKERDAYFKRLSECLSREGGTGE